MKSDESARDECWRCDRRRIVVQTKVSIGMYVRDRRDRRARVFSVFRFVSSCFTLAPCEIRVFFSARKDGRKDGRMEGWKECCDNWCEAR